MSATHRWLGPAQGILTVAGIGVAGYLTYVKLFGIEPYSAGIGSCESVQSSPYAEIFGIPVAVLGLGAYLVLLGLWWMKERDWQGWGSLARQLFFLVTLAGVLFSAYLTYLELFVILEICIWCVASAIVMLLLFALALMDMRMAEGEASDESGWEVA